MSTIGRVILVAILIYVSSYLVYRQIHTEVWAKNGQAYVIFSAGPGRFLYYLWRPLSYVDASATGVGAHIGPHQD